MLLRVETIKQVQNDIVVKPVYSLDLAVALRKGRTT